MPADSSIYGLVDTQAPAKLSSLLDPMNGKIRQAKQMALDEEMQGFEDKRSLRDLLKTANTRDPEQLAQMAYDKGLPGAAQDFLKQSQAVKEASLREQKNKIDMANSQLAYQKHAQELASSKAGFVFANPTDENMAQLLMSQGVPQDQIPAALSQLPRDVTGRQRFMVNAFSDWKTRSEQVNPKAKEIPFEYEQLPDGSVRMKPGVLEAKRQLAEAGRSNSVNYGAPVVGIDPKTGQPIYYRPDNLGGMAPTGIAPPPKDTVTSGGGKIPAEVQRMNIAMESLKNGLSAYEAALTEFNPRGGDQFDMTKRAKIEALRSDLVNQAKEANALGALTGPDLKLMDQLLGNPASFSGVLYGSDGMKAKIKEARDALVRRKDAVDKQYGLKPDSQSAPSMDVFVNDSARRINDARKQQNNPRAIFDEADAILKGGR